MKKISEIVFLFSVISLRSFSQTPDWSTSVAPILYDHCTKCHHDQGLAPFALLTYGAAVDNAINIQANVNVKKMPPWPPDPNYSHFKDENVLSDIELSTINDWVNNGMPEGDTLLAPIKPVYNGSSLMLNPDEVIHFPVFTIAATSDTYWRFVNHSGYTETKYLNSVEFVASNPAIIHHVVVAQDTSDISSQDDDSFPGPGFPESYGTSTTITPLIPQSEGRVITLPENLGFEIPAGADYVTDMHYITSVLNEVDSSKMNVKFSTVVDVRPVRTELYLYSNYPCLTDGPLDIPANTIKTFHEQSTVFTEDVSLLGLGPHGHLVCKSWLVYMVTAAGDTVQLISIPNWDFDWQGGYLFTKVLKIPEGSQLFATIVEDNTTNNPNNPNNPPEDVHSGPGRKNEMARVHFWVMDYQEGDENIILDSSFYDTPTNLLNIAQQYSVDVFPNPASDKIRVQYNGVDSKEVFFSVYSNLGELLFSTVKKSTGQKETAFQFDCFAFPEGMYVIQARDGDNISNKKFLVIR